MQNLIIGEAFDYILLFILALLPLFYKLSFWLYTIQLKEYRFDRFKEYIFTKQGKSALFNIFFILELFLLVYYLMIWGIYFSENVYNIAFWGIGYNIMFYYLVILNIFVIGKIFRKRILKPKFTGRLILLLSLFIILGGFELYYFIKLNLFNYVYIYILSVFLLMPVIIFFYNFISLPLVNYKKNKQINSAIKKSKNPLSGEIKQIKIGITGSYGKSSVKEFLSSILEQNGETLKTPENKNTEMSVSALVLNKLNNKFKYFVAEMGAYKIGEISLLGKIVNHKYGFLTAIGNQHIGLFGSQENIAKGKFEIYESVVKNNGILYVNGESPHLASPLRERDNMKNIILYGIKSENILDAQSEIINTENGKTKFSFSYKNIKSEFEINLIGEHNVVNITGIIACCIDLGLKIEDIKRYLKNLKTPDSSKTIIESGNNILIDDTYNLSEAGLKSGLDLFKNYSSEYKKRLVLDDILELGKQSENIHKNIGKKIAEEKIVDQILFCGFNYKKNFIEGLLEGGFNKKNIILNLNEISEKSVILFEGRNAKKYLNKYLKENK
ncbi:MAG: UDP-N-acetylmuramoyl-tripeptide--D-alanyl-D-alanine ligase [Candidatus Gracilibacteria bacterium]|nr:UDP-N-acetylmuramoyl-tripeptide--D-alanyl-D-alanine ligase [Candidatus Gracilibacteria bacterium]MDQ7022658.1 UDP-N-acetylmuramoyl-tripeptide--D-alanyl-D-alanine ligase [Candidatus Gracilibacteria bacterium]